MGLNDAYLLAGNKTAKKVLVNLADYLVDVLAGLTDEQVQTMLNCEFGGMNEALAQVYAPEIKNTWTLHIDFTTDD